MISWFGLDYKPLLHKQIFEMIYFSQGAFTHSEVYTLPVYLRKFYYKTLSDQLQKENDAQKKQKEVTKDTRTPKHVLAGSCNEGLFFCPWSQERILYYPWSRGRILHCPWSMGFRLVGRQIPLLQEGQFFLTGLHTWPKSRAVGLVGSCKGGFFSIRGLKE